MAKMTSNRPYLVQAFYNWIIDNDCTPHLVVDAYMPGVVVPQNYVNDGQIVLNIAPRAVSAFAMDLKEIVFSTRFGGVPTDIHVPMNAVLGIYARENGQGMIFQPEEHDPEPPEGDDPPPKADDSGSKKKSASISRVGKRPSLKVVK